MLRTLERAGNRVASVVLTGSDSQNDYVQVVRLGARGLVLKADDPQKLFAAIRAVAEGELAFSDEIAHSMLDAMVSDQPACPARWPAYRSASGRSLTWWRAVCAIAISPPT